MRHVYLAQSSLTCFAQGKNKEYINTFSYAFRAIKLLSSSEEVKDPTTGELKIKVDGEEFKLMVIGNQQTDIENKSNSDIIIDYSNFYSQEEIVDSYLQWNEE